MCFLCFFKLQLRFLRYNHLHKEEPRWWIRPSDPAAGTGNPAGYAKGGTPAGRSSIEIDEKEKVIKIQFDDEKIAWYGFTELDQIEHSYAITIHKAQRKWVWCCNYASSSISSYVTYKEFIVYWNYESKKITYNYWKWTCCGLYGSKCR